MYSFLLGTDIQLDNPNDFDMVFVDSFLASNADVSTFYPKCTAKLEESAVVHLTFENRDVVEKRKEMRMTFTAWLANLGKFVVRLRSDFSRARVSRTLLSGR